MVMSDNGLLGIRYNRRIVWANGVVTNLLSHDYVEVPELGVRDIVIVGNELGMVRERLDDEVVVQFDKDRRLVVNRLIDDVLHCPHKTHLHYGFYPYKLIQRFDGMLGVRVSAYTALWADLTTTPVSNGSGYRDYGKAVPGSIVHGMGVMMSDGRIRYLNGSSEYDGTPPLLTVVGDPELLFDRMFT